MDPLSVTASAITLIDASAKLLSFLKSIRHANAGYEALCKELSTLNGYLESIKTTLNECQRNPLALSPIDRNLWQQSRVALADCEQTLEEMAAQIHRIKTPNRSSTIFRKARVAAEMQLRGREICSFRDKLHMSNWSLQTLLQVITVSLSLRNNSSQELTFRELRQLNKYLEASHRAATDPSSTMFISNSDKHLARNLKDLVRAARDFHTTASTTASTIYSDQDRQSSIAENDNREIQPGLIPKIPSVKLRHIETYLSRSQHVAGEVEAPIAVYQDYPELADHQYHAAPSPSTSTSSFDLDFDELFSGGLSKIAQRAVRNLDFPAAERILCEALARHKSSGLDDVNHRRLRIQLVLVNFFQDKGRQMEGSILDLAEFHAKSDPIARQLLYALALSHAHDNDSQSSQQICKRLWQSLRGLEYPSAPQKHEVLQLLAISYRGSGDLLLAEAIEEEFPRLEFRGTLPTVVDFILGCEELLVELFSLTDASAIPVELVDKIRHGTNIVAELADTTINLPISTSYLDSPSETENSHAWFKTNKKTRKLRKRSSENMHATWNCNDSDNTKLFPRLMSIIRKARTRRDDGRKSEDQWFRQWTHGQVYHEISAVAFLDSNELEIDRQIALGRRFSFEGTQQEQPQNIAMLELPGCSVFRATHELDAGFPAPSPVVGDGPLDASPSSSDSDSSSLEDNAGSSDRSTSGDSTTSVEDNCLDNRNARENSEGDQTEAWNLPENVPEISKTQARNASESNPLPLDHRMIQEASYQEVVSEQPRLAGSLSQPFSDAEYKNGRVVMSNKLRSPPSDHALRPLIDLEMPRIPGVSQDLVLMEVQRPHVLDPGSNTAIGNGVGGGSLDGLC